MDPAAVRRCIEVFDFNFHLKVIIMYLSLRITATLFFAVMAVCVTACATGSKSAVDNSAGTPVLPSTQDYPVPDAADFNVDLTLVNVAIDSQLLAMQDSPQVTFTVWGYDELAADTSASSLLVSSYDLRPQSVPYYLRFSESDLQSIEYQSGSANSLRFYITMNVDVDGDGQICNGDFRQDYSISPPERFPVTEKVVIREVPIAEVAGEICSE